MLDATERKVLAFSAFIAGCLLIAPGERVSAGVAWCLAAGLFVWHLALWRREPPAAAQPAPAPPDRPAISEESAPAAAPPGESEGGAPGEAAERDGAR